MSLVVVGTDTEVGKTVISGLILARYGSSGRLAYWKPIASGAVEGRDTETVFHMVGGAVPVLPETYLFSQPLSPHLAARLEGRVLEPRRVIEEYQRLRSEDPRRQLVIEGVGGVLVPLTDEGDLLIDLLVALDLPVLVVARSSLGTINHTLLTLAALRARDLEIAGVVMNGPSNSENHLAVATFGDVEVICDVETLDDLDVECAAAAARRFDPLGLLRPYLIND